MDIYIFGKTQKINNCITVSQFTQQLHDILNIHLATTQFKDQIMSWAILV